MFRNQITKRPAWMEWKRAGKRSDATEEVSQFRLLLMEDLAPACPILILRAQSEHGSGGCHPRDLPL